MKLRILHLSIEDLGLLGLGTELHLLKPLSDMLVDCIWTKYDKSDRIQRPSA